MIIRHNVSHEHISVEDLKMVSQFDAIGVDELRAEEKDRCYEIKSKIAECPECRRRVGVAAVAKKMLGRQVWELKRGASFTLDLRNGKSLELLKVLR